MSDALFGDVTAVLNALVLAAAAFIGCLLLLYLRGAALASATRTGDSSAAPGDVDIELARRLFFVAPHPHHHGKRFGHRVRHLLSLVRRSLTARRSRHHFSPESFRSDGSCV